MSDPDGKQIDREMAENESARQVASSFRLSTFAIVITIVIALALSGWVFSR